jgi:hypothetical protein
MMILNITSASSEKAPRRFFEQPIAAWKYVDLEHADAVAAGSLRIGTLSGYSALENGRADSNEGVVRLGMDGVRSDLPDHRRALERVGLVGAGRPDPQIRFHDLTLSHRAPPWYAFCMARKGCTYTPPNHKQQALFEIVDLTMFAAKLANIFSQKFSRMGISNVEYARIDFEFSDPLAPMPDPFVKHPDFRVEEEVRVVFAPRDEHVPEPFNTSRNPVIASHIRRIA